MISTYFKYEVWQLHNILSWIGICKGWKSLKGIEDSDHFPVYWQFKNKISICFIKNETEQGITVNATCFVLLCFFLCLETFSLSSVPSPQLKLRYFETCYFSMFCLCKSSMQGCSLHKQITLLCVFSKGNLLSNSFLIDTLFFPLEKSSVQCTKQPL